MNQPIAQEVNLKFKQLFANSPIIVQSPGRINLIGEHTDYNNGFVLPAAIDKSAYIAIGKRLDDEIHLYAMDFEEHHQTTITALQSSPGHWHAYLLGIVDQLKKRGLGLTGFNAVLSCNVPIGGGMSSSAAVECATVFALNELFNFGLERLAMVQMAQKAENEFVGVQCGIMDMFASMMGKKEQVILLDCSNLAYQYFPLELGKYKIVLFDTTIKHSLAGGEYNFRRQQCEEGVAYLQTKYNDINSLRDATIEMIDENLLQATSLLVYNRCKYVVEEINRVQDACADLVANNLIDFGKKMYATHAGLKDLYEVSCAELDLLVDWAKNEKAIIGSRMMGGGFGGCTINLIEADAINEIFERFETAYKVKTGLSLKMYVTVPQAGTSVLNMV
jgi:galactokinase